MPAGFRFPLNTRDGLYMPVHLDAATWMTTRGGHWLRTVGRLKDGVSVQQAQADLQHVFANIGKAYPDTDGGRTVRLQALSQSVDQKSRGPLWVLLGAVLAVLAIGCVNIAGLLLSRGVKRQREMAMRVAIGAGRIRLLRQMFTEGLLLALAGAGGGVLLAWSILDLMRAFLIKALQRGADIHLNWTVLGASVALAVVASLAASLYPALKLSGVDPNTALRAGGSAGTGRGEHRLRAGFVITQVALTLVLLVVAGLLMRVVTPLPACRFGIRSRSHSGGRSARCAGALRRPRCCGRFLQAAARTRLPHSRSARRWPHRHAAHRSLGLESRRAHRRPAAVSQKFRDAGRNANGVDRLLRRLRDIDARGKSR